MTTRGLALSRFAHWPSAPTWSPRPFGEVVRIPPRPDEAPLPPPTEVPAPPPEVPGAPVELPPPPSEAPPAQEPEARGRHRSR